MSPATARLRSKASRAIPAPALLVDATLKLDGVDLTNEASTIVTDKLTATARLRARLNDADTALQIDVAGMQGQMLVNPVSAGFRQESAGPRSSRQL